MKNASFRDLNESSLLVWPHDHSNNHYATVAADFSDCTIVFANGLGKESTLDKDGLLAMGLFLLSVEAQARSFNSGRRFEWKVYVERTRRQADGKSCGPDAFASTLALSQGSDARLIQDQFDGMRDTMAGTILLSGTIKARGVPWDDDIFKTYLAIQQNPMRRFETIFGAFSHLFNFFSEGGPNDREEVPADKLILAREYASAAIKEELDRSQVNC